MQLWNLCSAKSAVFTGFAGFPCLYLPGKETPLDAKIIAPMILLKTSIQSNIIWNLIHPQNLQFPLTNL